MVGSTRFPIILENGRYTDHANGLPAQFAPHPFSKHDTKMSATNIKQPAGTNPPKVAKRGQRFYMNFGFMRSSTNDY